MTWRKARVPPLSTSPLDGGIAQQWVSTYSRIRIRVAAWNFRQLEFPFYRKQGLWAKTRKLVCSLLSCNKPGNLRDPFQLKRGFWMDWMDYQTTFFSLASLCGESLNTAPLEAVLVMEGCHLWTPITGNLFLMYNIFDVLACTSTCTILVVLSTGIVHAEAHISEFAVTNVS